MTIIRDKIIISLTEEEREAIRITTKLAHDIYYGLNNDEINRLNNIMKVSWTNEDGDVDNIAVGILDLFCLLDSFQENIDEFNK